MYEYKAFVKRVIDGDTYECIIDLGCYVSITEKVRLFKYDTPEIRTRNLAEKAHGLQATEYVKKLIEGKTVELKTRLDKKGKYGRFLAEVFIEIKTNDTDKYYILNLGESLKQNNLLKRESYDVVSDN